MRITVIASVVLAISGAAFAQDDEMKNDGLYLRIGAGAAFPSDLDQDIANPLVASINTPPNAQTIELSNTPTFATAIGFDYADGIRTELEYRYLSAPIDVVTPSGGFSVTGGFDPNAPSFPDEDFATHFVFSNFYFDWRNSTRFTPFIGGGVGGAFVTNEDGVSDAALAYQGRAGVSYALSDNLGFDVEYVYINTNDFGFGSDEEDFTIDNASAFRVDGDGLQVSSVMASVRIKF